jgi:hypothetical protein
MDKVIAIIGAIVVSLGGILLLSFLLAWPVYMLWNGCLVDAFTGVKEVSWLQAWGLNILCGLLFNKSNSIKSNA